MALPSADLVFKPGGLGEAWADPFHSDASSDGEDKAVALEPADWEAKFDLLDTLKGAYGSMSAVANTVPVCNMKTLKRRYEKRQSAPIPLGAKPVLPAEAEMLLVEYIRMHYNRGFPMTFDSVKAKAKEIAVALGGAEMATLVGGDTWLQLFLGRHPELKKMSSSNMESERVRAFSREAIGRYVALVKLATDGLKPENIYMADEAWLEHTPLKPFKVSVR